MRMVARPMAATPPNSSDKATRPMVTGMPSTILGRLLIISEKSMSASPRAAAVVFLGLLESDRGERRHDQEQKGGDKVENERLAVDRAATLD